MKKRKLENAGHPEVSIPVVDVKKDGMISYEAFLEEFNKCQALIIKNAVTEEWVLGLPEVEKAYVECDDLSKKTWSMEFEDADVNPLNFLSNEKDKKEVDWYGSFILKGDENMEKLRMPIRRLPVANQEENNLRQSHSAWIFVGENTGPQNIQGRPLHTDSVPQNGTWHFQASGSKLWFLKPTTELRETCNLKTEEEIQIECRKGDIILVNTRLWWHKTEIPSLQKGTPTISYAIDIFLNSDRDVVEEESDFTNVTGFYAAEDMEEDTIIVRADEMPNCELPTSADGNCKVVELEDGEMALVSTCPIKMGEWYVLCEEDDNDDDDDDDEEEEEEEEEAEYDDDDDENC